MGKTWDGEEMPVQNSLSGDSDLDSKDGAGRFSINDAIKGLN